MNQTEIKEALAQQEEHLKRIESCGGKGTMTSHAFRRHGSGRATDPWWSQCVVCGVTETDADYQTKLGTIS